MNSAECKAFKQLQQCVGRSDAQDQLSGWVVKTGRQGLYYLHECSSLSFQTLGAARVAMHVFKQNGHNDITSTEHVADDDEDEEKDEVLSLCSCLDGVISHLQKQVETLKSYQGQPQETAEANWAVHCSGFWSAKVEALCWMEGTEPLVHWEWQLACPSSPCTGQAPQSQAPQHLLAQGLHWS